MDELIKLVLGASPLGIIAILAVIIYLQVRQQRATTLISDNHLSGLPDMQATLERIAAGIDRLEERQARIDDRHHRAIEMLTYLTARLNGAPKPPSAG